MSLLENSVDVPKSLSESGFVDVNNEEAESHAPAGWQDAPITQGHHYSGIVLI